MSESTAELVARCVQCDASFTEVEIAGAQACPRCGSSAVPLDPKKDIELKINILELRILTIWADWWAKDKCTIGAQKTLSAIIERLSKQLPNSPLTFAAEIRKIQEVFPNTELISSSGEVLIPKKDPAS